MIFLSKKMLPLTLFLSLAACAQQDFNAVDRLPDEAETEQALLSDTTDVSDLASQVPNTENFAASTTASEQAAILKNYDHIDPKRIVNTRALAAALTYFDKNQEKIKNKRYISVIDFSRRSTQARFFIISMSTGEVWAIHTAHGKGSDKDHDGYAERFSNTSGSNASSLGYYLTAETYFGKHGLSLKLDGLSHTNSNARRRAVVIHGASYVKESSVIQGRSWGCPAVANHLRDKVIGMLKGGSLIYAVAK